MGEWLQGTQKLKLPSLVISRRVRFAFVQNTSSSDVLGRPTWEAWAPQLECLGTRRAPRNFYLGDQLWGLGDLNKMLGSLKGSLKFCLEHSLAKNKLVMKLLISVLGWSWCLFPMLLISCSHSSFAIPCFNNIPQLSQVVLAPWVWSASC